MAHSFAGFVHLVSRDIDWSQQRNSTIAANTRSAAVGVMIAVPMLLVFTVLFVKADAAFEKLFTDLLKINIGPHVIAIALGTWLAGSYLRGVLVPSAASDSTVSKHNITLGGTELNVALGLLNLLFAAFVAVQLRYLFGTAQTVEATPGLTYATYARRGFFELVIVALLVLPILLTGDRLHTVEKSKRVFRIQSLILVGLVFCIMASAMHRMRLYQFAYGLTELRFYVSAFMIFLAIIFVLFCFTVLRGWGGLFPMGTVGLGFAAIFVLHAINPDQWIASANLANARAGRKFDPLYFKHLSADAVPSVLANANALNILDREAVLSHHRTRLELADDWRSWNYGRHAAARVIRELPR
jgi:hypothetical protein